MADNNPKPFSTNVQFPEVSLESETPMVGRLFPPRRPNLVPGTKITVTMKRETARHQPTSLARRHPSAQHTKSASAPQQTSENRHVHDSNNENIILIHEERIKGT